MLSQDNIKKNIERDKFLKSIIQGSYIGEYYRFHDDLRFLCLRKWNSWYPSYFKVEGGCYALLIPKCDDKDLINDKIRNYCYPFKKKDPGVIVIDPGFRFLELLRRYNIEAKDIGMIITSHFHSDHIAGLLEFLTLVGTMEERAIPVQVFLNPTSFKFFGQFNTRGVEFYELRPNQVILLALYSKFNCRFIEKIYLHTKEAHHREIGQYNQSLALSIAVSQIDISTDINDLYSNPESNENYDSFNSFTTLQWNIQLLGDTDGHEHYIPEYINFLTSKENSLLCLHLGTIGSSKMGAGDKHLYDKGVIRILEGIINQKKEIMVDKIPIIISEFGLELASDEELIHMMSKQNNSFNWRLILLIYFRTMIVDQEKAEFMQGESKFEINVFIRLFHDYIINVFDSKKEQELANLSASVGFISYFLMDTSVLNKIESKVIPEIEKLHNEAEEADGFDRKDQFKNELINLIESIFGIEEVEPIIEYLRDKLLFVLRKAFESLESYENFGSMVKDIEKLFKKIREYCTNKFVEVNIVDFYPILDIVQEYIARLIDRIEYNSDRDSFSERLKELKEKSDTEKFYLIISLATASGMAVKRILDEDEIKNKEKLNKNLKVAKEKNSIELLIDELSKSELYSKYFTFHRGDKEEEWKLGVRNGKACFDSLSRKRKRNA